MLTDIEISRQAKLLPIQDVANKLGLLASEVNCLGNAKAKIKLSVSQRSVEQERGKLIIVTAVTPIPFGEGKTVTSIGLAQGLDAIGEKACACIRQPSMGPVFGIKGGAAGGGYAQVVPMDTLNLHLTGDIHAVTSAHNLAAAAIDARLYHETRLGQVEFERQAEMKALCIDPEQILWRRVVDHNDRSLRQIKVGFGEVNGPVHDSGFDITAASELMAILALSHDLQDMRARIGRIELANNLSGEAITAEDLGVAGAMAVIMREAIEPTLMQTLSGVPCLIHAGPFANIAHGNSSIIADDIALKLADYVVTEGGFGSDMGFEKFCNIKARQSGQAPSAVVLVTTLKALKANSGIVSNRDISLEDQPRLEAGFANLEWHINNASQYGVPVVVAINQFVNDSQAELDWLQSEIANTKAFACALSNAFTRGAEGATALAEKVIEACQQPSQFSYLYASNETIEAKLMILAEVGLGAAKVVLSDKAKSQLTVLRAKGVDDLPICLAKTPLSISHDPRLKGVPKGFSLPIEQLTLNAGAGFITALVGKVMTMPGLGIKPGYLEVELDANGDIQGLA